MADDGLMGRLIRQGFRQGLDRDSNLLVATTSVLWVVRFANRVSRPREEVLYSSKLAPGRVLSISGELFEFAKAPDISDERGLLEIPGRPLKRRERRRARKAVKAATPPRRVIRKARRIAAKADLKAQRRVQRQADKQAATAERKAQRAADRAQKKAAKAN